MWMWYMYNYRGNYISEDNNEDEDLSYVEFFYLWLIIK